MIIMNTSNFNDMPLPGDHHLGDQPGTDRSLLPHRRPGARVFSFSPFVRIKCPRCWAWVTSARCWCSWAGTSPPSSSASSSTAWSCCRSSTPWSPGPCLSSRIEKWRETPIAWKYLWRKGSSTFSWFRGGDWLSHSDRTVKLKAFIWHFWQPRVTFL